MNFENWIIGGLRSFKSQSFSFSQKENTSSRNHGLILMLLLFLSIWLKIYINFQKKNLNKQALNCLIYKFFFALKYYPRFIIHYLGEWEDENNWLLKLWFLNTFEAPIDPILKFNNFLWLCWFLRKNIAGKNLSNFVPPVWKLYNSCCHNEHKKSPTYLKWKLCCLKMVLCEWIGIFFFNLGSRIILKRMKKKITWFTPWIKKAIPGQKKENVW